MSANRNKYISNAVDPFKIIKYFLVLLSIIVYNSYDNLNYFPLTIDNQSPIIQKLMLICIGCHPNHACNIYIGILFSKQQSLSLSEEIIMLISIVLLISRSHNSRPYNSTRKITWKK